MLIETFIQVRGPLFEAVQKAHLFPDDKIFVDATPKDDPEKILNDYLELKDQKDFDLKTFVLDNFSLPHQEKQKNPSESDISLQIDKMWELLTKNFHEKKDFSTLIPLPHPHVVPGGRFREAYYWDSYFIIEGLVVSKRFDLVKSMINNLSYLIDHFGFIPNGNRFYYLTRSQQPYFSLIVDLLHREGFEELALSYYPQLVREYSYWMNGEHLLTEKETAHKKVVLIQDGYVLNRYFDEVNHPREEAYTQDCMTYQKAKEADKPYCYQNIRAGCESGWDFSSRFLKDPNDLSTIATMDYIPVDLNCLLFHHEMLLSKLADLLNKESDYKKYAAAAERRKEAMVECFWDEKNAFFFDYNHKEKKKSSIYSLAALFPLFFEICDSSQAEKVKNILENSFLKKGGLLSSLTVSKQQWDAPNGWAPLHLIAYMGLKNYGFDELAKDIAKRFVSMCRDVFFKKGLILEKYNVETASSDVKEGEYDNQIGFGWTNAVIQVFLDELKS